MEAMTLQPAAGAHGEFTGLLLMKAYHDSPPPCGVEKVLCRFRCTTSKPIAKSLLDYGIHPPTMYFPLIVEEALMVEPTETESRETLDEAIAVFREIWQKFHASFFPGS